MKKPSRMTQSQFGRLVDVSQQRISQLIKQGVIKVNKKKLLDPIQARDAMLKSTTRPDQASKTKDFIVNADGTCTTLDKLMFSDVDIQASLPLKAPTKKSFTNLNDANLALKLVDLEMKENKLAQSRNEIYEEAKKELLKLLEPTFKTIKKLDDSEVDEIITLAQSFGVENIVEFRDELVLLKEKKNNVIIEFEVKNGQ